MADPGSLRDRLYKAYASEHAGQGNGEATATVYRRILRPLLPPPDMGPIIDIGCGQGALVRLLESDGYDAEGVDVSPEQVAIAQASGADRVQQGDYRSVLGGRPGQFAAVTATDLLEHLTKYEVLEAFDAVHGALMPGGVFVARVPNAVSPFGGYIRYGDFTHETWFTARSVHQLAMAGGFGHLTVLPCPPVAHGMASAARAGLWKLVSGAWKGVLAAETGVLCGHIVTQNMTFSATKAHPSEPSVDQQ